MDPCKPLVLIVHGDGSTRKTLAGSLHPAGYEVIEARNGREALDLTSRFQPDVILVDAATPLIDGFKVCQYVKADPQIRSSKVVILTGNSGDLREAVRAGADDCVAKPIAKNAVLSKVRRALGDGRPPGGDRREHRRPARTTTVSWGFRANGRLEVQYKNRVIDISPRGFSFQHVRCTECTGYEKDTVHPQCPFFPNSKACSKGEALTFVIHLPDRKVLEIQGRIAHVFQPPDWPGTEKVGVVFTRISRETAKTIRDFLTRLQTQRHLPVR